MARVSYVPYDESYVLLFQFCHVDVPEVISYTDTIKGWDPTAFAYAIDAATVYLDDNMDALAEEIGEDKLEGYYDMLNYSVTFWSTEAPYYG